MINKIKYDMLGKRALIIKTLYELKSSERECYKYLGNVLRGLGFKASQFDSYVSYKLNKDHNLYQYVKIYTDD